MHPLRIATLIALSLCATLTGCVYSLEAYEAHGPDRVTSPDDAMLCVDGRRVQYWTYSKPDFVKGTHAWSHIRDGDRIIERNLDDLRTRIFRYSFNHNNIIGWQLYEHSPEPDSPYRLNQVRVICVEPMICLIQPGVEPTDFIFPQYGTKPVQTEGLLWFSPDTNALPAPPEQDGDRLTITVDWGWIFISKSTGEITALSDDDLPPA
ncbi:MAG: hypothetical protein ACF8SC_08875 [Phycisphaerales bacterium JB037]